MLEMLAPSNQVIWANPFGKITGAILPRITTLKEGLTIYNPGFNLLPLKWLSGFNERRRLMQVNMYLLERDFTPDLVWFDDHNTRCFAAHFGKKGAVVLYYALDDLDKTSSREERRRIASVVDLVITPSPDLYKKYREYTKETFLLSGGDLLLPNEPGDEEISDEQLERMIIDALQVRLEEVSKVIEKALSKKPTI